MFVVNVKDSEGPLDVAASGVYWIKTTSIRCSHLDPKVAEVVAFTQNDVVQPIRFTDYTHAKT